MRQCVHRLRALVKESFIHLPINLEYIWDTLPMSIKAVDTKLSIVNV